MQKSENQNLNRRPNRTMLRRTLFLMTVCGILAFGILIARLYILQIRDHEKYEELAISQQLRETLFRSSCHERQCRKCLPQPRGDRNV